MILFERSLQTEGYTLVGEAVAAYDSETGRRTSLTLSLYIRGPKGGKNPLWSGDTHAATTRANDLLDLVQLSAQVPDKIEVSP